MIEIRGLSKSFKKKEILRDLNISFDQGVYGLLGPNGAGKTTLLRCMTGVYPIAPDTIFQDGVDVCHCPDYTQTMGYLPQKFGMYRGMRTEELLGLFADMKKIPRNRQVEEISACLKAVGLEDRAKDKIRTLSGGMIRRMGIAQALLGPPPLMILDEPTAGLDPEERVRFKNLIAALPKERVVILSTHIVEDVALLCDHIIVLVDGEIKKIGTGPEVSACAQGKVYAIPVQREQELVQPCFICRRGETELRVFSPVSQPGQALEPTIEDGYLCYVKGYV